MTTPTGGPHEAATDAQPPPTRSTVIPGRDEDWRWWQVAGDRVGMARAGLGWDARVERAGWGGLALDINAPAGHFADEAEALAWCERMVEVLTRDARDEGGRG
jgi:hypothetical protein